MTSHDQTTTSRNSARRLFLPALAAGALLFAACGDDDSADTAATDTAAQDGGSETTEASDSGGEASGSTAVEIVDFEYMPPEITVAAGAEVTWSNADTTAHTATGSDQSFNTGTIDAEADGTATAPSEPGEYPYICSFHPFMKGTLIVE